MRCFEFIYKNKEMSSITSTICQISTGRHEPFREFLLHYCKIIMTLRFNVNSLWRTARVRIELSSYTAEEKAHMRLLRQETGLWVLSDLQGMRSNLLLYSHGQAQAREVRRNPDALIALRRKQSFVYHGKQVFHSLDKFLWKIARLHTT